ncbi:helix-turn-helix transcriptional regulator [Lysobacter soli]|uniref:helix-turn-helix transcriptional regulator n=1 Tax=Lysobacter soli TaxID=453783 RepID=UPI00240F2F4C|nr:helix-turn-helix transcriptional regulator [Lysobacter soli]MDG2517153.1 helix-turn-helix transcriptional regulator [Lysobacter soli]
MHKRIVVHGKQHRTSSAKLFCSPHSLDAQMQVSSRTENHVARRGGRQSVCTLPYPESDSHQAFCRILRAGHAETLCCGRSAAFVAVLHGRATLRLARLQIPLDRRCWVSMEREHCELLLEPGALALVVHLPPQALRWMQSGMRHGFSVGRGRADAQSLLRLIGAYRRHPAAPGYWRDGIDLRAAGELPAMLAALVFEGVSLRHIPGRSLRVKRTTLSRLRRAQLEIEYGHDVPVSMSALASRASVSTCHMSKIFTRFNGIGVRRSLIKARMERAALLLAESDAAVLASEIGESVGYRNACAFTRAFSNYFGVSPSEFRKRHKAAAEGTA